MNQTKAQRKASRRAIDKNLSGIFAIFRFYTKFQLTFALFSLFLSIILLFIGTFAYYEANIIHGPKEKQIWFYESILNLYGINETEIKILPLINNQPLLNEESTILSEENEKLHNYQFCMVFVAVVSIMIEIGIICSIIFEHFKLSVLYNLIMLAGMIYYLNESTAKSSSDQMDIIAETEELMDESEIINFNNTTPAISRHKHPLSLTYQLVVLTLFILYSLVIKAKRNVASKILASSDIEMRSNLNMIQNA